MSNQVITFSKDFQNFTKILHYNENMVIEVAEQEGKFAAVKSERYIINEAKDHYKTGEFENSIFWEKIKTTGQIIYNVASDVMQAIWLEFGTRAHTIEAKNVNFLRFEVPLQGVIYAKKVKHPGTKADPMFTRTYIRFFIGLPGRIVNKIKARALTGGK